MTDEIFISPEHVEPIRAPHLDCCICHRRLERWEQPRRGDPGLCSSCAIDHAVVGSPTGLADG